MHVYLKVCDVYMFIYVIRFVGMYWLLGAYCFACVGPFPTTYPPMKTG